LYYVVCGLVIDVIALFVQALQPIEVEKKEENEEMEINDKLDLRGSYAAIRRNANNFWENVERGLGISRKKRLWIIALIGVTLTIVAATLPYVGSDAHTTGYLIGSALSKVLPYTVILAIVSLVAVKVLRKMTKTAFLALFAWLFFFAGLADVFAMVYVHYYTKPRLEKMIEDMPWRTSWNLLQKGMTPEDVTRILGSPVDTISHADATGQYLVSSYRRWGEKGACKFKKSRFGRYKLTEWAIAN